MQVILETIPAPFPGRTPDGKTADGAVQFQVQVYTAGEEGSVWPNGHVPNTASEWLKQVNGQDRIMISPPASRLPTAPPMAVPAALLRALPGDALVVMEWSWRKVAK